MIDEISLVSCEFIPSELSEGVIYYSERFLTTSHLCACGCRNKIVLSVKPQDWSIAIRDGRVTISPSVGNRLLDCRSHYFIRAGKIIWLRPMSDSEAAESIAHDRSHRERYFAERRSWWDKFLNFMKRVIGRLR